MYLKRISNHRCRNNVELELYSNFLATRLKNFYSMQDSEENNKFSFFTGIYKSINL